MKITVRNNSVHISGYVNAVERLSEVLTEYIPGQGLMTFRERISAGAFRKSLQRRKKIPVLLNHDDNKVLATSDGGNATFTEDNIGLHADVDITDADVVDKAKNGELIGWSFGFDKKADMFSVENGVNVRTVEDLDLLEVSLLDNTKIPAYKGTSIESRTKGGKTMEIRIQSANGNETLNLEDLLNSFKDTLTEVISPLKSELESLKASLEAKQTSVKEEREDNNEEMSNEEEEREDNENNNEEIKDENEDDIDDEERAINYSYFESAINEL